MGLVRFLLTWRVEAGVGCCGRCGVDLSSSAVVRRLGVHRWYCCRCVGRVHGRVTAAALLENRFGQASAHYWCTWPVDSSLSLGMAEAFPARRSAVSVPEAAWLFGTVTERLAIRADRRLSTPFEQGESGAKRPDLNPGASFEPKCSDRLRCEHAHPSLPPVYFAQCPVRALHMHCVTMN